MIAIGAKCSCGWGPQDVVELGQGVKYLRNLTFIVGEHSLSCPNLIVPVTDAVIDGRDAWGNPRPFNPERCDCGHLHDKGAARRRAQCPRCYCKKEQPIYGEDYGQRVSGKAPRKKANVDVQGKGGE